MNFKPGDCGDCKEGVIIHEGRIHACRHCKLFADDQAAVTAVWELLCQQTIERHELEENHEH